MKGTFAALQGGVEQATPSGKSHMLEYDEHAVTSGEKQEHHISGDIEYYMAIGMEVEEGWMYSKD